FGRAVGFGHRREVGLGLHEEVVRTKARHRGLVGGIRELEGEREIGLDGRRTYDAGGTSSTVAEPMPPPPHMLTHPSPPPRSRSSSIVVATMRAPVAATG